MTCSRGTIPTAVVLLIAFVSFQYVEFVPMAQAQEMIRTGRKPGRNNPDGL